MTHALLAITPVDGRYSELVEDLRPHLSEFGLIRCRLLVEVEYLSFLARKGVVSLEERELEAARSVLRNFDLSKAEAVKSIEREVGHDVEALIRFLKSQLAGLGAERAAVWVHAGLTSEDVNNLAFSISLREALRAVLLPELEVLCRELAELSLREKATLMLARTHGQPAVPTTLGKELAYHGSRVLWWIEALRGFRFPGKVSGAVGTYAALVEVLGGRALEGVREFVESLGLEFVELTKQVIPADRYASLLDSMASLSTALTDLSRDLWLLCALGHVTVPPGGVGSSTMPQKANPVEAENAEGNFELAASLLSFASRRLQITRLQRDLSDSTVRRNVPVGVAHLLIGVRHLRRFLSRIGFDREGMLEELRSHPEALSEAVQVRFRRHGVDAMDELRSLLRQGVGLDEAARRAAERHGVPVDEVLPKDFREYVGLAEELAERFYADCVRRLGRGGLVTER
ncbi:MAG: lyase family protein [Thaumarchaeota archaeon]|nr:lyase family protein [Candidatus Calditenuaceae archaeon]MDW8041286.1 lyase family protein [Nitrososphaerota archaeon]